MSLKTERMSDTEQGRALAEEPSDGSARAERAEPDGRSAGGAGMPRWVEVAGLIVAAGVILLIVMLALGHGPGRHGHAGGASAPSTPVGTAGAATTGAVGAHA